MIAVRVLAWTMVALSGAAAIAWMAVCAVVLVGALAFTAAVVVFLWAVLAPALTT